MTHKAHPKIIKGASFNVYVDGLVSLDELLERRNFHYDKNHIKAKDFQPERPFKKKIEMNIFQLTNLPGNSTVSTEEVLTLIRYYKYRPAHLWEGLSIDDDMLIEHRNHLVMFLLKTVEQGNDSFAPGIKYDGLKVMLNLYRTARHWKEGDCFAAVPEVYIYPPLF